MTGLAALAKENSLSLSEITGQMIHTARLQISPCIGKPLNTPFQLGSVIFSCFLPDCCLELGSVAGLEIASPRGATARVGKSGLDTPPTTQ